MAPHDQYPYEPPDVSNNVEIIKWRRLAASVVTAALMTACFVLIAITWGQPEWDRGYQAGLVCFVIAAVTQAIAQSRDDQARAAIRDAVSARQRAQLAARMDEVMERTDTMLERVDLLLERTSTMMERVDLVFERVNTMLERVDVGIGKIDTILETEKIVVRTIGRAAGNKTTGHVMPLQRRTDN